MPTNHSTHGTIVNPRHASMSPSRAAVLILLLASWLPPVVAQSGGRSEPATTPEGVDDPEPGSSLDSAGEVDPASSPENANGADSDVESTLSAIYGEIAAMEGVAVSLRNGVVELSGTIGSPRARQQAETIASRMPDVVYVENLLAVEEAATPADSPTAPSTQDQAVAEKLRAVFSQVDELDGVQVEVSGGVVQLMGETPSAEASERAQELAQDLEGVLYVDNDIEESTDVTERLTPDVGELLRSARVLLAETPLFLVALLTIAIFWLLAKFLAGFQKPFTYVSDNALIQGILRQVARTLIVALGIFIALEILDATALVGAVLGTAGVVGLAVGFAFRDIVENYLASIILSLRQPFAPKDFVKIDDQSGTVVRMTTRDTVLMTPDGNHVRIPNANVFKSTITNITRNPLRRFEFSVGVGVDEDLVGAQKLGLDVLNRMPGVLDDPAPFARIGELADSNVSVKFFGWVNQHEADYGKVKSEAIRLVKTRFDEDGIDMPVPTYKVDVTRGPRPGDESAAEDPQKSGATERSRPEEIDVSVQRDVDEQVEKELQQSDEPDLLDKERNAA